MESDLGHTIELNVSHTTNSPLKERHFPASDQVEESRPLPFDYDRGQNPYLPLLRSFISMKKDTIVSV